MTTVVVKRVWPFEESASACFHVQKNEQNELFGEEKSQQ